MGGLIMENKKKIYIYSHLGAGDHISQSGIIRYKCESYDKVYVFCKPHNIPNVSFLYRDEPKIKLIAMDDAGVRSFMWFNPDNEYLIVGHDQFTRVFNNPLNTRKIDEIMYDMGQTPLEYKWSKFKLQRDPEREQMVFDYYKCEEGKYSFVHDKEGMRIKRHNPGGKQVRPDNMNFTLFDYLKVIENAREIHVINSSFFCLIDVLGINKPNMYLHNYLQNHSELLIGRTKSPWHVI